MDSPSDLSKISMQIASALSIEGRRYLYQSQVGHLLNTYSTVPAQHVKMNLDTKQESLFNGIDIWQFWQIICIQIHFDVLCLIVWSSCSFF